MARAQERAQYLHQFVLHASLDAVDEQLWNTTSMHLGVVDKFNNLHVRHALTLQHLLRSRPDCCRVTSGMVVWSVRSRDSTRCSRGLRGKSAHFFTSDVHYLSCQLSMSARITRQGCEGAVAESAARETAQTAS